jgi:hypothetical protein
MAWGIASVGLVLAVLAGAMAYLITLNAMRRHMRERRAARAAALQDAVFTATFFACLALVLALVLPWMFATQ